LELSEELPLLHCISLYLTPHPLSKFKLKHKLSYLEYGKEKKTIVDKDGDGTF
jgi:hypothetical protein